MMLSFSCFLNSAQCIILRLEGLDERPPISAETIPNNVLDTLVDEMVRKFELFLMKGLHDQLAIDQILQSGFPGRFELFGQFLPLELRMQ